MSSAVLPVRSRELFRVIDWRLVAAIGLPVWAFTLGIVIARPASSPPVEVVESAPSEPSPAPAAPQAAVPVPVEPPAPREIVRKEFVTIPVAVPIPALVQKAAVAESVEPAEFKLPASEVMPADRCKTFDTKIRFHPGGLPEAADAAKESKKMLLVLHISGNFDDPGFT